MDQIDTTERLVIKLKYSVKVRDQICSLSTKKKKKTPIKETFFLKIRGPFSTCVFSFFGNMWVKKYVEICIMLFKN